MQRTAHIFRFFGFWFLVLAIAACSGSGNSAEVDNHEDLKDLPRTSYNKGGVSFSLANVAGIYPVHRDSVGWATYMVETDGNGQVIYYFMDEEKVEMSAAQIRVEYIAKSLPNCSTEDSLFNWLKQIFLAPDRQGQVISDGSTVRTMDGQDIELLEIHTPETQIGDSLVRSSKTMAWAYVDHDTRFVAFNFSANDQDKYDRGMKHFRDLVRSYKDE